MAILHTITNGLGTLYRRMTHHPEDARLRDVIGTLRAVPLFQELSRGTLRDLAEAIHVRDYKRDEFLYYERDPGLGFYIVQRGCVRLLAEDEDGNVHELRQVCDHDLFGDLSILGDFRRLETAQAVLETRVLGFFRPDLQTMMKRNPKAAAAVLAALARHVAAWHTEVLHRVATQQGKVAALHLLDGTVSSPPHAHASLSDAAPQ